MPVYDLPRAELESYLPDIGEPADFDAFWAKTLAETRAFDLNLTVTPVDTGLRLVDVFDVEFAGFGGHPIKAWLTRPAAAVAGAGPLPAVVEYNGYGGGRGLPHEHLGWASAGYVSLYMDTRGQGSQWGSGGDTPDPVGSGPAVPGFLTRGLLDPADHFYRRVFTDAVRAVEAVRAVDGVDPTRVAVTGGSQGGGITLAVAGLVPGLLAAMPDVPFGSHFRRAVDVADTTPYTEITQYLSVHRGHADAAFRTLSYLDGVSFARRASAPALFSVALMDPICPPSTVYAAYNHYGALGGEPAKQLEVYPFNEHEGGAGHQFARQLHWLAELAGLAGLAGGGATPGHLEGNAR
ncbi:acetylxylan esterase [Pengzhenrongella sicca]|uniref:Acetylxylan esterase n=1 Tax=Pengzhenrongella sicca TaxID=2819238 RepID=A0A8A4ZCY6_9MICO|nr:acetylxylan esterase [Pengzhenrongella sicca]QTE28743.1 acetylxylan esterase [Pengzhenrongella sicca]